LAGAAHSVFVRAGEVPDPDDAAEQEQLLTTMAGLMGGEPLRTAYEEGAGLTVEEALSL
jgi:hypothetical protein